MALKTDFLIIYTVFTLYPKIVGFLGQHNTKARLRLPGGLRALHPWSVFLFLAVPEVSKLCFGSVSALCRVVSRFSPTDAGEFSQSQR